MNKFNDVLPSIYLKIESNQNLLFFIKPEWQFLDELEEDENSKEFKIFKEFMDYYFNKIGNESNSEKKVAIPGGKYGCALLAKI